MDVAEESGGTQGLKPNPNACLQCRPRRPAPPACSSWHPKSEFSEQEQEQKQQQEQGQQQEQSQKQRAGVPAPHERLNEIQNPQVGALAEDFNLPDSTGTPRVLSSLLTDGALLLIFYRGYW